MTKPLIVLVADDYAMTEGVSAGIDRLAAAGRLSATSAMTTSRHWPEHASRIRALSRQLAVGLHLDLTLLGPLGPMPRLAPGGRLPRIADLTRRALLRQLDRAEIESETERQLDAFERYFGAPPDHLDGHQHAHALPIVRDAVLAVLVRRYKDRPLLVRDPADKLERIRRRRRAGAKSVILSALSSGFGRAVRAAGFVTNDGFAGVSDFATDGSAADFRAACIAPGSFHMVMCHPGIPDAELSALDPVTTRRAEELAYFSDAQAVPFKVWQPDRAGALAPLDWVKPASAAARGNAA